MKVFLHFYADSMTTAGRTPNLTAKMTKTFVPKPVQYDINRVEKVMHDTELKPKGHIHFPYHTGGRKQKGLCISSLSFPLQAGYVSIMSSISSRYSSVQLMCMSSSTTLPPVISQIPLCLAKPLPPCAPEALSCTLPAEQEAIFGQCAQNSARRLSQVYTNY